jgi:hypothetical protein
VVTRHEVLRTVQVEAEGKPAQQVIPAAEAGVGFADEVPADRMATAATAAPAQALDPMATAATAAPAQALDPIVAVLTTLKAGGAYVPIHTACPLARMRAVAESSTSPILFVDKALREHDLLIGQSAGGRRAGDGRPRTGPVRRSGRRRHRDAQQPHRNSWRPFLTARPSFMTSTVATSTVSKRRSVHDQIDNRRKGERR